ncbi:MAG: hypothetical protein CFE34_19625 [Rhodobacteraceae bacterium PARR1]|nr:MAG: hypothetical protein CFE34_19625 [Rhodobacteraceae bacterium PARR1]
MTTEQTTPATIADAFAQWLEASQAAALATDPAAMEPHLSRAHDLEKLAVALPVTTAADVWHLIRMTTDGADDALNVTHGLLIARAFAEVAA